jgi:hypothetical protein
MKRSKQCLPPDGSKGIWSCYVFQGVRVTLLPAPLNRLYKHLHHFCVITGNPTHLEYTS